MAQLSNTTDNSGLVQQVEKWAGLPYGSSANTLREIINNLNIAFENIIPLLLSYNDNIRWEDLNHTDAPIGYVNIVSGQNDYKITTDSNSLDILNITNVRILNSATATLYEELERMTIDDPRARDAQSPGTDNQGTPTHFLEVGNRLYLYPEPQYAATNGIELFFGRQQVYFTVTGTSGNDTTEPGIPLPFHELLSLYAALDYISARKPDEGNLMGIISAKIQEKERNLRRFISLRNPTKAKMTMNKIQYL